MTKVTFSLDMSSMFLWNLPASIRYEQLSARYRFIKNAYWACVPSLKENATLKGIVLYSKELYKQWILTQFSSKLVKK